MSSLIHAEVGADGMLRLSVDVETYRRWRACDDEEGGAKLGPLDAVAYFMEDHYYTLVDRANGSWWLHDDNTDRAWWIDEVQAKCLEVRGHTELFPTDKPFSKVAYGWLVGELSRGDVLAKTYEAVCKALDDVPEELREEATNYVEAMLSVRGTVGEIYLEPGANGRLKTMWRKKS